MNDLSEATHRTERDGFWLLPCSTPAGLSLPDPSGFSTPEHPPYQWTPQTPLLISSRARTRTSRANSSTAFSICLSTMISLFPRRRSSSLPNRRARSVPSSTIIEKVATPFYSVLLPPTPFSLVSGCFSKEIEGLVASLLLLALFYPTAPTGRSPRHPPGSAS